MGRGEMSRKNRRKQPITEAAPVRDTEGVRVTEYQFQDIREGIEQLKAEGAAAGMIGLVESVVTHATRFMESWATEETNWIPIYKQGRGDVGDKDVANIEAIIRRSRYLYELGSHYGGAIDLVADYICGRDPRVHIKHDNLTAQKELRDEWKLYENDETFDFGGTLYEAIIRVLRDGLSLPRMIRPDRQVSQLVQWRFIDVLRLAAPDKTQPPTDQSWSHGIATLKSDASVVLGYFVKDSDKMIPAADVVQLKIGVDSDVKVGLPFLYRSTEDIMKLRRWLDSRFVLNLIRSALVIIREQKNAAPGQNARSANTIKAGETSGLDVNKNPITRERSQWQAGTTIFAAPGTEFKMPAQNIGADDAYEDGRALILTAARGANMPEYWFGGDASNANLASLQVAEAPGIISMLGWQAWAMKQAVKMVRRTLAVNPKLKDYLPGATIEVRAPSIAIRDRLKDTQANQIEKMNGVLSRRTWQQNSGYDPEVEDENTAEEQTESPEVDPATDPTGLADKIRSKDPGAGGSGDPVPAGAKPKRGRGKGSAE